MRLISSVPVSSLPFPRYLGAPDPELATEGIAKPDLAPGFPRSP